MHIEVRRIEKNELAQLSTIAKKTFFNTFINTCTAEDMIGFLEENYNDEKLLSELNNSSYHYFFATINNEVVGYLLFAEEYKHLSILQQWKALELKRNLCFTTVSRQRSSASFNEFLYRFCYKK